MTKKFKLASLEYHKLKSIRGDENIKKILNGTKIIASKTIKRGIIIPLTVFDIDHIQLSAFNNYIYNDDMIL